MGTTVISVHDYDPSVLRTYQVPNVPRTAPSENDPLQIFNEFWQV